VDVGNTSVHIGVWTDAGLRRVRHVSTHDSAKVTSELEILVGGTDDVDLVGSLIACVVSEALGSVEKSIAGALHFRPLVVGRDIERPLRMAVEQPEAVGIDRVCAAAAAYQRAQAACTVIDFGTAVTVDYVDDAGVFQGGAILPGPGLQAKVLGEATSALPMVSVAFPEQAIGRDTTEAIQSGICHGVIGAVRQLVEEYARRLNRWPHVFASGGDAALLVPHCDFVDTVVPDLCLHGIGLAYVKHLNVHAEDA
jgi:type III pantothenate kinase